MASVTIYDSRNVTSAIPAIKEIRAKAPMSLKDAKDIVERVLSGEKVVVNVSTHADAQSLVLTLEGQGFMASVLD